MKTVIILIYFFKVCLLVSQSKVDTTFTGFKVDTIGGKISKIQFVNGKPNGIAVFYDKNNVMREIGTWVNRMCVGNHIKFYSDGKVYENLTYDNNGKKIGLQWYYYENGFVKFVSYFIDGKEYLSIFFDKDGKAETKTSNSFINNTGKDQIEAFNSLIEIAEKNNREVKK